MTPSGPSDEPALLAARRLLADAEQAALDEVLALRAAADERYQEVVALRAEAARLVEQAAAEAETLRAERRELDARAAELDERALSAVGGATVPPEPKAAPAARDAVPAGSPAPPVPAPAAAATDGRSDPLAGAQAEMRALSALLDELQGRVEELGQRSGLGEDPPSAQRWPC